LILISLGATFFSLGEVPFSLFSFLKGKLLSAGLNLLLNSSEVASRIGIGIGIGIGRTDNGKIPADIRQGWRLLSAKTVKISFHSFIPFFSIFVHIFNVVWR
jgi:hypothetical protein